MQTSVRNVGGLRGVAQRKAPCGPESHGGGEKTSFAGILSRKMRPGGGSRPDVGLKFSRHAAERIESRGIELSPDDLARLSRAAEGAREKGSHESLLLIRDVGMIVNLENRTVVTAMTAEAMRERVFTNIDSTVIV